MFTESEKKKHCELVLQVLSRNDASIRGSKIHESTGSIFPKGILYLYLVRLQGEGLLIITKEAPPKANPNAPVANLYGLTDKGRAAAKQLAS